MKYNLITILGPTAAGKTKLAAKLAFDYDGEIISADSRQVYRGMDIGTGKDLSDYKVKSRMIPVHLVDVADPVEEFNLYLFKELFNNAFEDISARGKLPFLVGGTGLYLSSVLQGYKLSKEIFTDEDYQKLNSLSLNELQNILIELEPELHNKTDLTDKNRIIKAILIKKSEGKKVLPNPAINSLVIGISLPRSEIKRRITERLKTRLSSGMIEEAKNLIKSGISFERLKLFGLEYKYLALYLQGELNYNDMYQKLNSAIHNFAKRQMTWFRKMEKEGVKINWISGSDYGAAKELIESKFNFTKKIN